MKARKGRGGTGPFILNVGVR